MNAMDDPSSLRVSGNLVGGGTGTRSPTVAPQELARGCVEDTSDTPKLGDGRFPDAALDPAHLSGIDGGAFREDLLLHPKRCPAFPDGAAERDSVSADGLASGHGWQVTNCMPRRQANRFRARYPTTRATVFPSMTKRSRGHQSRYSLDRCVLEIAAMRERLKLQDKEIAHEVGISPPQFSHKMTNAGRSSFTVEELGRIADFFAERTGRALLGWPFVPEAALAHIEGRTTRPGLPRSR